MATTPQLANVPRITIQNQRIGVYLKRIYGNVRFKIRYDLGSNENVICVVELIYPSWAQGTQVGIPLRVLK